MDLEGERCEKEAASLLTPLCVRLHLYRRRSVKAGGRREAGGGQSKHERGGKNKNK